MLFVGNLSTNCIGVNIMKVLNVEYNLLHLTWCAEVDHVDDDDLPALGVVVAGEADVDVLGGCHHHSQAHTDQGHD